MKNSAKGDKKSQKLKSFGQKLDKKQVLLLIFCGALIGLVNGFFGGGGGMICVPLLEKVLNLENKYAHATTILIIFPISFVSAVVYLLGKNVQSIPLATVGAGVIFGGIVGSFLLKFLSSKVIRVIFALVMLAGGIRLLI